MACPRRFPLPIGLTDGKGQVQTRTFDALGRLTATQFADGTNVTASFDALSRRLTEANQSGIRTRTYDAVSQRLTELGPGYPSGLPLISAYDLAGNRLSQTAAGVQTLYGYDANNRMVSVSEPPVSYL